MRSFCRMSNFSMKNVIVFVLFNSDYIENMRRNNNCAVYGSTKDIKLRFIRFFPLFFEIGCIQYFGWVNIRDHPTKEF